MWAICDIAMHVIYTRSTNYDTRDFSLDSRIPSMYFQVQPDNFQNTHIYVPPDMYTATANSKKMGIVLPVSVFLYSYFKRTFIIVILLIGVDVQTKLKYLKNVL